MVILAPIAPYFDDGSRSGKDEVDVKDTSRSREPVSGGSHLSPNAVVSPGGWAFLSDAAASDGTLVRRE